MHFLYVFFSVKRPVHVSNRQAVHPQEALFTVYADIGTYHAATVTSCQLIVLLAQSADS